jgi:hypothetical protein
MLLANISVASPVDSALRRLTVAERRQLTELAAREAFHAREFRKTVRTLTGAVRNNLDQMFMDATAEKNLVFDPALNW